jgi:hypothetical protein
MRRLIAALLAMVAISISVPSDTAGAQDRTLVTDTWFEGASGGYNLQVWHEAGSEEILLALYHRDYGWLGVQVDEWVPQRMGMLSWSAGSQWAGTPGTVAMCHQNQYRGVAWGYDQSVFYAFVELAGATALTFVGSDNHGPYTTKQNVVRNGQYCAQISLN